MFFFSIVFVHDVTFELLFESSPNIQISSQWVFIYCAETVSPNPKYGVITLMHIAVVIY